ncbi:MAG: hypothetical protein KFF73_04790 [Cyclobacteriaceae bacterium]|nr:hypothetical protein [Cyclobacteriaceae bacterium]
MSRRLIISLVGNHKRSSVDIDYYRGSAGRQLYLMDISEVIRKIPHFRFHGLTRHRGQTMIPRQTTTLHQATALCQTTDQYQLILTILPTPV